MSNKKFISYKDAGVDIITGDQASKKMFEASIKTWKNISDFGIELNLLQDSFSGIRFINLSNLPEVIIGMNFDGVGTKIEIAERVSKHDTIALDLFAMVCDDAAITGGEPILIGSILDFNKVSLKVVKQLAKGMIQAAKISNTIVINGEIAELGDRVKGYGNCSYNWGASIIWIGKKERIFRRSIINQDFKIVGIKEYGLRSNGLSLIRKTFLRHYGQNWHNKKLEGKSIGMSVLEPSIIYTPLITTLTGGYFNPQKTSIFGIAHITGGGIPGKLGRILKSTGYGAILDNLFDPCNIVLHCQSIAPVSDHEAYKTWNMGNGLLIITKDADEVIEIAQSLHYEARIVGKIKKEENIVIQSQGSNKSKEEQIIYEL